MVIVNENKMCKYLCLFVHNVGATGEKDVSKEARRNGSSGDKRKSVGSGDGSVRSVPPGKCTQRENVPKFFQNPSRKGTPQARSLAKNENVKLEPPKALEDYLSLHGSKNSEGSEDGSVRSLPRTNFHHILNIIR